MLYTKDGRNERIQNRGLISMKAILEKAFIRNLSDKELIDKYNFMKKEIEITREMGLIVSSKYIEFKHLLFKEIKKRGLSYE